MPTTEGSRPTPVLDNPLSMLRRRWVLIAVAAAIGVALGLIATQVQKPKYRATASVQVTSTGVQNSADLANGRTNSVINLDTEAKVLRSTDVAEQARQILGTSTSSSDLAGKVEVTVPPNTEVLSISFTGRSPTAAQQGAHAFALAYLNQRRLDAQATLDDQIKKVEAQTAVLGNQLKAVSTKLSSLPNGSPDRSYTAAQRGLLTGQISSLNQLLGKLTTTEVKAGRLLTDAQLPTQPSSPSRTLNLASGLAVGLLIGLVVAWVRGRRDHRMFQPPQVQRTLGVPVVAQVPQVRLDEAEPPRTPAGEAYRRLANTLPAVLEDSTGVILVASATPGVAGDVVATNLASALARTGAGVTLLQVDRGSHFCAHLIGADEAAAVLTVRVWSTEDGVAAPRYVRQSVPGLPTLAVVSAVPSGENDPPVADDSGRGIVEHLRFRGNYLVVVAPSTASGADAQALASRSDAVILAVELGTTQEQALDALAQFDDVRAPVLGTVVLPRPRRNAPVASTEPTEVVVPELGHVGPAEGLAAALVRPPERADGDWSMLPVRATGSSHSAGPTVERKRSAPAAASAAAPDEEPYAR